MVQNDNKEYCATQGRRYKKSESIGKDSRQLFSEVQDKGPWSAFVLVLPPFCKLVA